MNPIQLEEMRRGTAAGAGAPSTWNPLDKFANVVLSNGNLTEQTVGFPTWAQVRGLYPKNTGEVSLEFYLEKYGSNNFYVGVMDSDVAITTNAFTDGVGIYSSLKRFYDYGSFQLFPDPKPIHEDYIGMTFNFDTGVCNYYLNGVFKDTLTSANLAIKNHLPVGVAYVLDGKITLNAGETPFQYPILATDGWFE